MTTTKYEGGNSLVDPTPEQWKVINGTLTAELQNRIKQLIPDPGSNPLLNEILKNMEVGIYSLQGNENEPIDPSDDDTPLEGIRKGLTVELRKVLQAMGLPSKGAIVGLFLTRPTAHFCVYETHGCSGTCSNDSHTGYGTCYFKCC